MIVTFMNIDTKRNGGEKARKSLGHGEIFISRRKKQRNNEKTRSINTKDV